MKIQNIEFGIINVSFNYFVEFVFGLSFNLNWLNMKNEERKQLQHILPISFLFWTFYFYLNINNVEFIEIDRWT